MRVLVLHTWGMGDLIMLTPMLRSLKASGFEVDLVLTHDYRLILQKNDFLNNIYVFNSKFELLKLRKKYDYLIASAGTNPKKVAFLSYILGIKNYFATYQLKNIHRIDVNIQMVKKILKKIIKEPYIYVPNEDVSEYLASHKNIGFAVGSGAKQKFKRWPYFKDLIKKIKGEKLVFIGPDEKELEEEFKNLDVTIVKEPLDKIIAIISKLDLLIGNDNGLMHIGYATNINTLTIFGMTNEKETGGYREKNKNVFLDLECRPCFDSSSDYIGCNSFDCLTKLSVEKVIEKCQIFL